LYAGVCECYARTHTLHVGYSDVSPWVEMRHLKSLKNLDGPNLGIYVFVHVYKEHMRMCWEVG